MNTYTNTLHPEKKVRRTARPNLLSNIAILTVILALVTAAGIAAYTANRPTAAAEDRPAVPYSNALEMQYARPWLDARNKPMVAYGNALEMQYARPWLETENRPVVTFGNALELQYARPWLEARNKPVVTFGNALELQYAQPWLDKAERPIVVTGNAQEQILLNRSRSMDLLYACKYGYRHP